MNLQIDDRDRQILAILLRDATTSKAEIARKVGLTPSAVFERIRKLEERRVIDGYQALLSAETAGLHTVAFVFVTEDKSRPAPPPEEKTSVRLAALPGVEEVHKIAGEDCFLVKVRTTDTKALARLLDDGISPIGTVGNTRTTIVLETVLEGRQAAATALELPSREDSPAAG